MKKKYLFLFMFLLLFIVLFVFLYFSLVSKPFYTNSDFQIETYKSNMDKDQDGIDDQTDILNHVLEYIETKPKYKSKYYETGYPNDSYGVCTDVVGYGLLHAGYDLMELVNQDILCNKEEYAISIVDKKIDFRRVVNLNLYFKRNAISLTTDLKKIEEWQGGDIVVFPKHMGIISNKRNKRGIPYLIHHANPFQISYEEDVLERYEIIGHYRIS